MEDGEPEPGVVRLRDGAGRPFRVPGGVAAGAGAQGGFAGNDHLGQGPTDGQQYERPLGGILNTAAVTADPDIIRILHAIEGLRREVHRLAEIIEAK